MNLRIPNVVDALIRDPLHKLRRKVVKECRPTDISPIVKGRMRQYRRRVSLISWVGAGFGGVIAVFTGLRVADHAHVPGLLLPIVPIAVVVGGFCLAAARVNFEWKLEQLDRGVEDGTFADTAELATTDYEPYPTEAELYYYLELVMAGVAGVGVIVLSIWSAT